MAFKLSDQLGTVQIVVFENLLVLLDFSDSIFQICILLFKIFKLNYVLSILNFLLLTIEIQFGHIYVATSWSYGCINDDFKIINIYDIFNHNFPLFVILFRVFSFLKASFPSLKFSKNVTVKYRLVIYISIVVILQISIIYLIQVRFRQAQGQLCNEVSEFYPWNNSQLVIV